MPVYFYSISGIILCCFNAYHKKVSAKSLERAKVRDIKLIQIQPENSLECIPKSVNIIQC